MEIINKIKQRNSKVYQVGDMFKIETISKNFIEVELYMLAYEESKYVLRNISTPNWQGLHGPYSTKERLFEMMPSNHTILEHYSRDDYELHLVKKEEK